MLRCDRGLPSVHRERWKCRTGQWWTG